MKKQNKPRKPTNLRGLISGRLVVTAICLERKDSNYLWNCRCTCGNHTVVRATSLIRGVVKSCGCLAKELTSKRLTKYGKGKHAIAAIWRAMISRCHNEKSTAYQHYGKRGIIVCDRWRTSFPAFFEDLGNRPPGRWLDRIDNNTGYMCGKCDHCKSLGFAVTNCVWNTIKSNQRNRRSNCLITYNGQTKTLIEWSEEKGINYGTLWSRLFKHKWPVEKALATTIR